MIYTTLTLTFPIILPLFASFRKKKPLFAIWSHPKDDIQNREAHRINVVNIQDKSPHKSLEKVP